MTDYQVRQRERIVREAPVVEETVVHRDPVVQTQREVVEDSGAEGRVLVARISGLIWLFFGAIEMLIGLRFVLKFIAANPASDFGRFLYNLTDVFLAPFAGLVGSPAIGSGVIEIYSMIAMVVYALLAWLIVRLFLLIFTPARTKRSVTTYRRDL